VRLLLDEHVDLAIAAQLRSRGYDVVGVAELKQLRRASDTTLLDAALGERRVFVTRDYSSLRRLLAERIQVEIQTWGVIFLSPALPQGQAGVGAVSRALEAILAEHPDEDALVDREVWVA
jgi:hypothetical protein